MTSEDNDAQRERSTSRMRELAFEEMARALEQVGIDLKTSDGRRDLRTRLDYLDRLYEDQATNRAALDWAREMMRMVPAPRTVMEWASAKMEAERANREAVRKTLVDKIMGGLIWLLLGGIGGALAFLGLKGGHS